MGLSSIAAAVKAIVVPPNAGEKERERTREIVHALELSLTQEASEIILRMDPDYLTSDKLGRLRRYGQHFIGTNIQGPASTMPETTQPVQDAFSSSLSISNTMSPRFSFENGSARGISTTIGATDVPSRKRKLGLSESTIDLSQPPNTRESSYREDKPKRRPGRPPGSVSRKRKLELSESAPDLSQPPNTHDGSYREDKPKRRYGRPSGLANRKKNFGDAPHATSCQPTADISISQSICSIDKARPSSRFLGSSNIKKGGVDDDSPIAGTDREGYKPKPRTLPPGFKKGRAKHTAQDDRAGDVAGADAGTEASAGVVPVTGAEAIIGSAARSGTSVIADASAETGVSVGFDADTGAGAPVTAFTSDKAATPTSTSAPAAFPNPASAPIAAVTAATTLVTDLEEYLAMYAIGPGLDENHTTEATKQD